VIGNADYIRDNFDFLGCKAHTLRHIGIRRKLIGPVSWFAYRKAVAHDIFSGTKDRMLSSILTLKGNINPPNCLS